MSLPRLYLGESGDDVLDSPFIEQNGVLAEAGREAALTEVCLRAVASSHVLVLSGIGASTLQAVRRATSQVWVRQTRDSPFVDLRGLRQAGAEYLAGRSTNTRQQIRRSDRFYAAGEGLAVNRAASMAGAHCRLDALAELHQTAWTARGLPGCFATPFFGRFHHALIDRAFPAGQMALVEVCHGKTIVGILYNFVFRKRVSAYQSGFDYAAAQRHGKPGLSCHHAAIQEALRQDIDVYDFLAGDDRYKRSLADESERYYWVEAGPWRSPRLLRGRGQGFFRK